MKFHILIIIETLENNYLTTVIHIGFTISILQIKYIFKKILNILHERKLLF